MVSSTGCETLSHKKQKATIGILQHVDVIAKGFGPLVSLASLSDQFLQLPATSPEVRTRDLTLSRLSKWPTIAQTAIERQVLYR